MCCKCVWKSFKTWKNPLNKGINTKMVARSGFEPETLWLKVKCSTNWASEPHRVKYKMAASDGLEPSECQSQSLMPYHLATRQSRNGGGTWIWTMEPEGTDLQSAAFDHFAIPPKWCRKRDSNPQPTDYKSVALPITLFRHKNGGRLRTRTADPLLVRQML